MINYLNNSCNNVFTNYKYFDYIISILNFGLKFIPCFFKDKASLFITFLNFFENELHNFNKQIFFRNKKSTSNNSTTNTTNLSNEQTENKSYFDYLFKQLGNNVCSKSTYPLQKETLDFKFEIYEQLSKSDGIVLSPDTFNLNSEQFRAIKDFLKRKPFVVCDCDKNIGVAIVSHEIYNKLCYTHLNDTKNFIEVQENPLPTIENTLADKLLDLNNHKIISKKLYDKLFKLNSKLASFRVLPKLHKDKFSSRPIVNNINA